MAQERVGAWLWHGRPARPLIYSFVFLALGTFYAFNPWDDVQERANQGLVYLGFAVLFLLPAWGSFRSAREGNSNDLKKVTNEKIGQAVLSAKQELQRMRLLDAVSSDEHPWSGRGGPWLFLTTSVLMGIGTLIFGINGSWHVAVGCVFIAYGCSAMSAYPAERLSQRIDALIELLREEGLLKKDRKP